ncbi:MAG TPA: L,D-transpeptidase/peptidoglycan binding protein [Egibacteraceae bacterium]|nr:L,D-transpeptidase/peptidoglycan binding protein [Egibacteraceae bacterium]
MTVKTVPGFDSDDPGSSPRRERRRWPLVTGFVALFIVFMAAGAFAGATKSYADSLTGRLLPGTTIAGVDVSGLTQEEALVEVRGAMAEELDRRIVVRWEDQRWVRKARKLGARTNARAIIAEVAQAQTGLSWRDWAELRWFGERADVAAEVQIRYRRAASKTFAQRIANEVALDPVDAELTVAGTSVTITPDRDGRRVKVKPLTEAIHRSVQGKGKPVRLDVEPVKADVTAAAFHQVLLLDQSDYELTLFVDGAKHRSWTVATGTGDYPTPLGRYEVTLKRYLPTWVNPDPTGWGKNMPASIPPGPDNPLGVRALNWSAPGAIRFHGTQAVNSLGTSASHGCVRMSNDDVVELYDLVDVGAIIISQA